VDRNFTIRLESRDEGEIRTVFSSPDEGMPEGTERFIWSGDSQYVLLVGSHFFVERSVAVGHSEQAYLLLHLPTKRVWCNSRQTSLPRLTQDVLSDAGFASVMTRD
jgi:hypothetical protein